MIDVIQTVAQTPVVRSLILGDVATFMAFW